MAENPSILMFKVPCSKNPSLVRRRALQLLAVPSSSFTRVLNPTFEQCCVHQNPLTARAFTHHCTKESTKIDTRVALAEPSRSFSLIWIKPLSSL